MTPPLPPSATLRDASQSPNTTTDLWMRMKSLSVVFREGDEQPIYLEMHEHET